MVDVILFTTALISAIISYLTAGVFFISFLKEHKSNRFLYAIAFILYAIGHTIQAGIAIIDLDPQSQDYVVAMWIYVNLGGAGTTGLILYSTFPFFTEKSKIREIVTAIFIGLYVIGSALLAFILPTKNPLTLLLLNELMSNQSQLTNMSWWVVELLIVVSFFIGIVFLRHFKISGRIWGFLIGLSFIIYAIVLFIWPIPELKPLFYIIRTISVGFLSIGGILLSRE